MTGRRVVVIGGGLAGITAAIALRDAGAEVTLLESRPRLGGAATSYARAGMMVDNGQHVFLRCCTHYTALLARLGVTDSVAIQDRFDVTVLAPDGPARLRRSALPSPLHLARALAGYRLLSLAERAKVGRAALAFGFANPASLALDGQPLGEWLAARGQGERARRRLWDLFIISALNIDGDQASTALAAKVIKTALLGRRDAADIGIATVPLGRLHADATAALLGRLGAQIRLGARATAVERLAGGGFLVRLGRGERAPADTEELPDTAEGDAVLADGIVLAVPPEQAARLAGPATFGQAVPWTGLGYSPIVNVHVIYDQQVTDLPFVAAVDSPVQWVFDKTRQAGVETGQYLAVSVSAADDLVDVPTAAIRELFVPALERLFPAAAKASIRDFFVTRERRATFRQGPGCGSLRPGAGTPVPGLVLAGAWTATGWPDTMEGAVRSGHNAARELTSVLASLPATDLSAARAS
ncbi:MAG TPA: hydroxysqualene dehydroxylase HpnE [Streptosporangiaceae bacterium]|jgi:squalene-associated FAD-dependent desaturase